MANLLSTVITKQASPDEIRLYNIRTNEVWYNGAPELLSKFYKQEEPSINPYRGLTNSVANGFFWNKVTAKYHKTHSGIPRLVVDRMKELVNTGFTYETGTKGLNKFLDEILTENDFTNHLFDEGIATESIAGYTVYKLSYDESISDLPIIETVDPSKVDVERERGRVLSISVRFETEDSDGATIYNKEIFSKGANGKIVLSYVSARDSKFEELISPIYKEYQFEKLDRFPIMIKHNTTTHSVKGVEYGESDFTNCHSLFDEADEKLSQLSHKIRHANPKRFISEDLLLTNADGNTQGFNDFETDYILTDTDLDSARSLLDQHTSKIETKEYVEAYKATYMQILSNVGLSPVTVGDFASAGLNNSGDTLRQREMLSYRTRNNKLKLWKPFLEEFFSMLLDFAAEFADQELYDADVEVSFAEYDELSFSDRLKLVKEAQSTGLFTKKELLAILHPDLSDKELEKKLTESSDQPTE